MFVQKRRRRKKNGLKPSDRFRDFNSGGVFCSTMAGLFRAKAASYQVWSGSNVFHGDKSPVLFWCSIAKECLLTTATV